MHIAMHNALNRVVYYDELRFFRLAWSEADRKYLQMEQSLTARPLTRAEISRYAADPSTGLHQNYVGEALANDDECFALLDGEQLTSYSWYSQRPTILTGEFRLSYPSRFVYMHHSFTAEAYRGRRLHTIGILFALRAWAERGHEEFLCVVSATNANSLKSTARAGYRPVGRVWMGGAMGHYVFRADRGCRRHGCTIVANGPQVRFTALHSRRFVA